VGAGGAGAWVLLGAGPRPTRSAPCVPPSEQPAPGGGQAAARPTPTRAHAARHSRREPGRSRACAATRAAAGALSGRGLRAGRSRGREREREQGTESEGEGGRGRGRECCQGVAGRPAVANRRRFPSRPGECHGMVVGWGGWLRGGELPGRL
jgi:hypothetical protein